MKLCLQKSLAFALALVTLGFSSSDASALRVERQSGALTTTTALAALPTLNAYAILPADHPFAGTIAVIAKTRSYFFPAGSVLTHSGSFLFVRAFNDLFVFNAAAVTLHTLSAATTMPVSALPAETSTLLVQTIHPSKTMSSNPCADCLIPITSQFSTDATFGVQPIVSRPATPSASVAAKYAFTKCPSTGCIGIPEETPTTPSTTVTTSPPSYPVQACLDRAYTFNTAIGDCEPNSSVHHVTPLVYWGSATAYNWGSLNLFTKLYFNDNSPQGTNESYIAWFGYWWGTYWIWAGSFTHFGGYRQDVAWAPTLGPFTWAHYESSYYNTGVLITNAFGSGAAITLFG